MADEKELHELCDRIVRLSGREQTRLLEMVLAGNRRRWTEEVARQQAETLAFLELERQQQAAASVIPPEAKREVG